MNGAESLVHSLLASGVDTCFANPGTSEMHFVAALDRIPGMRCVLGLFEGVVTGAADGYARMADRPAVDAAALRAGPRQRAGQPAQRAAGALADRQRGRRSGLLPHGARPAAGLRHGRLGARRVGLDAHGGLAGEHRRRCRRGGAGGTDLARPDRHADRPGRRLLGRGRRRGPCPAGARAAEGAGACGERGRSGPAAWRAGADPAWAASRSGPGRWPTRIGSPVRRAHG